MRFDHLVFAFALALVVPFAQASLPAPSATSTYDLGMLDDGDRYLSGASTSVISVAGGSFYDVFNFSLSGTSILEASAGTLNFSKFKIINDSFIYFLYGPTGLIGSGDYEQGISGTLTAGDYHLDFVGTASGANGGRYNGVISIVAVPEPETYALFLAGLGLIGAVARRRKQAA